MMNDSVTTLLNVLMVAGLAVLGWFLKQIYEAYQGIQKQINEHETTLAVHTEKLSQLQGMHRRKDDV